MHAVPHRKPVPTTDPTTDIESLLSPRDSSTSSPLIQPLPEDTDHENNGDISVDQPSRQAYELESPLSRHDTRYQRVQDVDEEDGTDTKKPRSHGFDAFTVMADCAVVLLPLAIAVFVVMIWQLNDQIYVEGSLDAWRNGITIASTAFPILFAAIAGRFISAAAHWNLERGAPIGLLETLMGSRTVGSTIVTLLKLRALELRVVILINVGLLLLWAISPLGAQSFLRMLSTEQRIEKSYNTTAYFDINYSPSLLGASPLVGSDMFSYYESIMASIYSTLILTPSSFMENPLDLWGNVKIPFLPTAHDGSWTNVSHHDSDIPYASLLGIPFDHTFSQGNTSFRLESSYIQLKCTNFTRDISPFDHNNVESRPVTHRLGIPWESVGQNGTWQGHCPNDQSTCNGTGALDGDAPWSLAIDTFIGDYWIEKTIGKPTSMNQSLAFFHNESHIEVREPTILFQARSYPDPDGPSPLYYMYFTTCKVHQMYLESKVDCVKSSQSPDSQSSCVVVRQRPSSLPHPPGSITLLSMPSVFDLLSHKMPRTLTRKGIAGHRSPRGASPDLQYLYEGRAGGSRHVPFDEVPAEIFSKRLSQLLNTFLGATQMIQAATLGTAPMEPYGTRRDLLSKTVTATFSHHVIVSQLWIAVCLASCLVLMTCGVFSVLLTHRTKVPDVLGYVTSSIRDSKFIDMPRDIMGLDGLSAARHVQQRRIRLGEIETHQETKGFVLGIGDEASVKKMQ